MEGLPKRKEMRYLETGTRDTKNYKLQGKKLEILYQKLEERESENSKI